MAMYRKKPVVIEARRIFTYMDMPALCEWIEANGGKATYGQTREGSAELLISTLEGTMTASVFDYVIKGVKGEFYPCKPDIFDMTYDAAI